MCGIWACLSCKFDDVVIKKCVDTIIPRGPEGAMIKHVGDKVVLGFSRLAINGLTTDGMQPMEYDGLHWICNGEIYNWKELAERHGLDCGSSQSDCSVIGPLWRKLGGNADVFFKSLDGVFSIVLYDERNDLVYVGRDPYGVRPLFYGYSGDGVVIGSELKSLMGIVDEPMVFMPGTWATFNAVIGMRVGTGKYHTVPWLKNPMLSPVCGEKGLEMAREAVRETLTIAVRKRLMTERPVAALLSGGIDSSLIAALVQRELRALGKPPLQTFSIGFKGSPDLKYARMVADWIGSEHTEIVTTPDDFFAAIPDVIRDIESYDITSVRASVGNWMVCREIAKQSKCKVVFNGDGADEVFGSYLYFNRAPSEEEFEEECGRLLNDIHYFDVLRSDRCISSHGLEARTPFLDKQFVAVARSVATQWRLKPRGVEQNGYGEQCNEKWILRMAFDGNLLPDEVIWRRKEAFSDGVSSEKKSWYEEIQDRVSELGLDGWKESSEMFSHLKPISVESYYYRTLFEKMYKGADKCIPYFWMPKWSGETKDPSARTLSVYKA
jgi:asparagine synthase (glutamine-hydrolysing)